MKIKMVSLDSLVFDPNNARLHPEKNLEAIKGSLVKFGQQKPIVVDRKGIVLAGNGTLAVAKMLGWDKIAVVESELESFDATAYALADNKTSDLGGWNIDVLEASLTALKVADFDIGLIGFDSIDVGAWDDGQDRLDNTDENLDGITAKVIVKCESTQEGFLRDRIAEAIRDIKGAYIDN